MGNCFVTLTSMRTKLAGSMLPCHQSEIRSATIFHFWAGYVTNEANRSANIPDDYCRRCRERSISKMLLVEPRWQMTNSNASQSRCQVSLTASHPMEQVGATQHKPSLRTCRRMVVLLWSIQASLLSQTLCCRDWTGGAVRMRNGWLQATSGRWPIWRMERAART